MGFGYNPNLSSFGERLDILNFFSWMKSLQDEFSTDWFVYDASGYYIVNRTPQKKITKLGDRPTAEQILDVLVSEQERPKRQEIMRNCDVRSLYLKRAIELSGISAAYIDSRQVFREYSDYRSALELSLEYVSRLQIDNPELVSRVVPENANAASELYFPLEIAEALYLELKYDVSGKFGPLSEEFFDCAILGLMEENGISYQSVRCSFGPRKPGYLSDENVILTTSSRKDVAAILKSDPSYKEFVAGYLSSFMQESESVENTAVRVAKEFAKEVN